MNLRFDGLYFSGPREWEDWHAGVLMHGIHCHYFRYYPNRDWVHCYRDAEFDFWQFTKSVTPELFALAKNGRAPRIGDGDELLKAGTYTLENCILVETFAPDWTGKTKWETHREVRDGELLGPNGSTLLFEPRLRCPEWSQPWRERAARCRITLPSRGHPTSGFACCRPPLMSNVSAHVQFFRLC